MYDSGSRHRRSIRLRGYDYTQAGAYFVTICTFNRLCLFGEIVGGVMEPSALGQVVEAEWLQTARVRPNVALDAFVVMPNHVHGIVLIEEGIGPATQQVAPTRGDGVGEPATQRVAPTGRVVQGDAPPEMGRRDDWRRSMAGQGGRTLISGSLGAIVGQFKAAVTKRYTAQYGALDTLIWQRNYYDRVIRSEHELSQIREYIANNPARWEEDADNLSMGGGLR